MCPGAPLTNFNDGGSDRGSYFMPKNITTSEFVYSKNHNFFSIPKQSLSHFFTTQKNPRIFHRPQSITFGQNFRPKKITQTPPPPPPPPSLKYVSGAPG